MGRLDEGARDSVSLAMPGYPRLQESEPLDHPAARELSERIPFSRAPFCRYVGMTAANLPGYCIDYPSFVRFIDIISIDRAVDLMHSAFALPTTPTASAEE